MKVPSLTLVVTKEFLPQETLGIKPSLRNRLVIRIANTKKTSFYADFLTEKLKSNKSSKSRV